jgi:HK97 family phage major capsid protein
MSDVLNYFSTEKQKHLDAAKSITETAKQEVRGLTDDERNTIKTHMTAATEFDAKVRDLTDAENLQESIDKLGESMQMGTPEQADPSQARDIGGAFTASEAYRGLKARGTSGRFSIGPVEIPHWGRYGAATVLESTGDNGEMFTNTRQRIPGIQTPVEVRLGLADLFPSATIENGNSVVLVKETVTTNAAAIVAEGAAKPGSTIGFDTEVKTLEKIATVIKVSTEMMEDESAIASYLNNRLETFVLQQEEEEMVTDLLAGAGQTADANDVTGGVNLFDAIMAGAVKVRTEGGFDADAVAMSMNTYAGISVAKSTTSGDYYSGGPYGLPGQLLWGRFKVAIVDGLGDDIVVGAFAQAGTVWRKRQGVTVEATNSNEDDFLKNLTAIRAEERMVLHLQRPDAFCTVTLNS